MIAFRKTIISLIILATLPILAGPRLFESPRPLKIVLEQVIDALSKELQFQIVKVYNGQQEGKEGIILAIKPRGTKVEILFVEKTPALTRIVLRSQDAHDGERLSRILTKAGLKELGVEESDSFKNTWPVDPFK